MKESLTPRQAEAYKFIAAYMDEHGWPPTIQEIADELGVSSKSTAHQFVQALQRKGWIEIAPGRHRQALRIVRD